MRKFLIGLRSPFEGLAMLRAHPSLRRRLVIPYMIIFVVFGILVYLFASSGVGLIHQWVDSLLELIKLDSDAVTSMRWYQKIAFFPLFYLAKIILYIVSVALMMLLTLVFGNVLCAFFWEILIEEVFVLKGVKEWVFEEKSILRKVMVPLFREIIKELFYVMLFVLVWLVTVVPAVGPVISLVLGPPALCFWFGFIICDFSMSVMAAKVKDRMAYGKKHWLYLIGVGVYALIPVVGLLAYPLFIVGHAKNMATQAQLSPKAIA